jgi:putative ABC transport system permease protein
VSTPLAIPRGRMTAWRAAVRVARREARRAKGRTALVLAMITVPVLFLAFAVATYDMFRLTDTERLDRELGAADAQVRWLFDSPISQAPDGEAWSPRSEEVKPRETVATDAELLARLPPGTRVVRDRSGSVQMRTATGTGGVPARVIDATDPIAAGIVEIRSGRAPAGAGEVALTAAAAARLGASIGDTVRSADAARSWTVVGSAELPADLGQTMVFHPDGSPLADDPGEGATWLVDTPQPLSWNQVEGLNQHGIFALSRAVVLDPPPAGDWPTFDARPDRQALTVGVLIAGLAVLEIVLLAGPAFAVGARRRQRDLALVAANGGTPGHLRRIVLADGIVLGASGAVIGIVLGVVVAMLARPLVEEHVWHARAGGYRFYPLALVAIAAVAVLTGLLAALVPAFVAARQDVANALAGRRGVVRSRRRWIVVGLATTAAGGAVATLGAVRVSTNLILAGVVLGELGLVICTPALVGLISRIGRLLPLAPRIALRDTARNRAAAAPAISAVMAAVAGAVAIGVYLSSNQARQEADYAYSLPPGYASVTSSQQPAEDPLDLPLSGTEAVLRRTLPVTDVFTVSEPACPHSAPAGSWCAIYPRLPPERECPLWTLDRPPTDAETRAAREDERCAVPGGGWTFGARLHTFVDDGTILGSMITAGPDEIERAAATLRAGGVVVTDPRLVVDGRVTLLIEVGQDAKEGGAGRHLPNLTVPGYALRSPTMDQRTVFSPGVLARAGFTSRPLGVVAATSREPTQAEQDRFNADLHAVNRRLEAYVERGPHLREEPALIVLAVAAGLITLGAAGIATGLAAADGRADLSTLAAVGASPRLRRLLSLSQSGVISGLGSLLGVAAGLGASFAVLTALNRAYAEVWPPPTPYPLAVPWKTVAIVLIVPLVAVLGAGLLTRSRLPIERRLV